jgi:hypothetical protein
MLHSAKMEVNRWQYLTWTLRPGEVKLNEEVKTIISQVKLNEEVKTIISYKLLDLLIKILP